jgi:hypothetical protein
VRAPAAGATEGALDKVPHSPQNLAFSGSGCPHCTQVRVVIGRADPS